jgi:non-lysosomal glucosylceramidase
MWLADGRWRQWESFSCVNVDSVHNDGERHIPYLMLLGGNGTESKMRAWAAGATTTAAAAPPTAGPRR